jgi:hypothetical protein
LHCRALVHPLAWPLKRLCWSLLAPTCPPPPRTHANQGSRATLYRRCVVEIFARFGECSRWDGLVQRATRYADDDRTTPAEARTRPPPGGTAGERAGAMGLARRQDANEGPHARVARLAALSRALACE